MQDSSGLPVFDLAVFLQDPASPDVQQQCEALAACLRDTGCVIVRDPRVDVADNERFLDMLERYFSQPDDAKAPEIHPELAYQVGATPAGVEVPRCLLDPNCSQMIESQPEGHRATLPTGPDLKWRYFWRVGPRPASTQYAELNADPVIPPAFAHEWQATMDGWGSKMLAAVEAVARMAALGFGLPSDAFTSRMRQGPHLLAPTGGDLGQHCQLGKVFAGYHYDLNFLTIHGKSRFPGLFVWLRDGTRLPVRIPAGCLLLQAGKQFEWLTGGFVQAGMHEVLVVPDTVAAVDAARSAGRCLWRVSSTLFSHIASDEVLQPLGRFASAEANAKYPAVPAGEQVKQELEAIRLKRVSEPGLLCAAIDAR